MSKVKIVEREINWSKATNKEKEEWLRTTPLYDPRYKINMCPPPKFMIKMMMEAAQKQKIRELIRAIKLVMHNKKSI